MLPMTLPATSKLTRVDGTVLRYCLYGQADGYPVVSHGGSPSSRWKRPALIQSMRQSELSLLVYGRPGYGGSDPPDRMQGGRRGGRCTRPRRRARLGPVCGLRWLGRRLARARLRCAALLADRVTRCAVLSGIKPGDPGKPSRDEPAMRSRLAEVAADIMGRIDAGGPELPTEPGPPALDDPDAMARLRATFIEGMDGWVGDSLAFARRWGLELATITVPVGIWRGTGDANVSAEHADYLLAHIATAQRYVYSGGHLPGPDVYHEIYEWLHTGPRA